LRRAKALFGHIEGTLAGYDVLNPAADEEHLRAIVRLNLPGGETRTITVGPNLLDALPEAGQRVRISYLPANEVVVNIQPIVADAD